MEDQSSERLNLDELLVPVRHRPLSRLPRLLWQSMRLVWAAGRREATTAAALQLIGGFGLAAQLLVGRELLERIVASVDSERFAEIVPSLIVFALVSAVVSFTNLGRIEQQRLLTELVAKHAIGQVLEVSTAVELISYERPGFHNRLRRALANGATRPAQMASGVLAILSAAFAIGGIAIALLLIEPAFVGLVFLAYVPAWLATVRASKVIHAFTVHQTERDRERDYFSYILSRKEEAAEIRAFDLGAFFRERYNRLYDERIAELRTTVRQRLRLGLIGGLVTSALTAGTIAFLVWYVVTGRMGLAEAGTAAGGVVLLGQRLQGLTSGTGSLYESSLFVEDFTTFVEIMPSIVAAQGVRSPSPTFERLTVSKVSFSYPSREEVVLRDVDMEIRQGEIVALVGENGSGKTTLVKLLAGLYQPDGGTIRWDDDDVTTLAPEELRRRIAVIFQDFVKYMLPARENISVGDHGRFEDMAAVIEAAERAGAHSFLAGLPDGYTTRLGAQYTGGSDLSIGQWQRVALARAFFRDAPLIILDEPSAALDPRSEAELFESLRSLYRGRTVLIISHRFSSVRSADRIYVLQRGLIAETGSHDELMARGGLYAELFSLQAAAYRDAEA